METVSHLHAFHKDGTPIHLDPEACCWTDSCRQDVNILSMVRIYYSEDMEMAPEVIGEYNLCLIIQVVYVWCWIYSCRQDVNVFSMVRIYYSEHMETAPEVIGEYNLHLITIYVWCWIDSCRQNGIILSMVRIYYSKDIETTLEVIGEYNLRLITISLCMTLRRAAGQTAVIRTSTSSLWSESTISRTWRRPQRSLVSIIYV